MPFMFHIPHRVRNTITKQRNIEGKCFTLSEACFEQRGLILVHFYVVGFFLFEPLAQVSSELQRSIDVILIEHKRSSYFSFVLSSFS